MSGRRILLVGLLVGATLVAVGLAVSPQLQRTLGPREFTVPPLQSAPVIGGIDAQTFRRIAEAQTPMVVNIRSESRRQTRDLREFFGGDDPFRRFFGLPEMGPSPREEYLEGAGSGFLIDKSGLVLTNNHVVAGASRIEVGLFAGTAGTEKGQTYEAKVVGRDPLTDSALIRLIEKPSGDLPVAAFGDSNRMAPGDLVVAIGNPFNLGHTVTVGVVSAKGRPFHPLEGRVQEMLQTDTAINPGNSGGPLLNLRGEVIGINTAILSTGPGAGNVGIGFAVPINVVRDLLPQLHEGKVTRGRIGVQITTVPKEALGALGLDTQRGALVSSVERDGPAARAGIEPGDVILEYEGKPVHTSDDLVQMVINTKPGSTITMNVLRDKRPRTIKVTVESLDLVDDSATAGPSSDSGLKGFGLALGPLTAEMARRLDLPDAAGGAVVIGVDPRGAAARSNIRPGDVILEVDRKRVTSINDVVAELRRVPPGGVAFLLVARDGERVFLTITRAMEQ
jgi:serine protease Do